MPFDGSQSAELFDDVAATRRLIEGGWIQGQCYDGLKFCLYGALREVTHGWDNNPRYRRLHDWILAHVPGGAAISEWNDAADRTQADVLALLDTCLATAPAPATPSAAAEDR